MADWRRHLHWLHVPVQVVRLRRLCLVQLRPWMVHHMILLPLLLLLHLLVLQQLLLLLLDELLEERGCRRR